MPKFPWRPTKATSSAAIVGLFVAGVGVLAVSSQGFATTDVDLDDSGVWVTNGTDHLIGRMNHQAGSLDGAIRTVSSSIDVFQSGRTVLAWDRGENTLGLVDPASLSEVGKATPPASPQVGLGVDTVVLMDATKGSVWLRASGQLAGFTPDSVSPAATKLSGGVLAVTLGGTALVARAAGPTLTTITSDGNGAMTDIATSNLAGVAAKDELAVTAVGEQAVVLDRTNGTLLLPEGKSVALKDAKDVVLQQSGPASDSVVYATKSALVTQPLDGGPAQALDAKASGTPAPPVFQAGCAYGIWNGSATFVRNCAGTADDSVQQVEGATGELAFRVNWGLVVLNDVSGGGVWLTDDKLVKVDDWQQALPDKDNGDENSDTAKETLKEQLPERTETNRPPIAVDDNFGVRAGRVTELPVTANDSDPDGDVLSVELVGKQPTVGEVQPIRSGSSLQISVPSDASGTSTFQYQVDDGRGGTAEANVTVRVVPPEQNTAPKQNREAVIQVAQGGSTSYSVLPDWIDPDGDPLYLSGAQVSGDGDEVRYRADGTLTFRDSGKTTGRKAISVQVSDGRATTQADLVFDVRPAASLMPIVNADHYSVTTGESLVAHPLANDSDPQGGTLRLVRVDEVKGATINVDTRAGTFTFQSDAAGTYYATYAAANDAGSTVGLVRVDVAPPVTDEVDPIAVADTAVLPVGGSVLSAVLDNDEDPMGGVLIVQSVDVPDGSPVSVAVLNNELLRISEVRAFDQPIEFTYTVSNGNRTAEGTVTVISAPAPSKLQPPVAADDEATVRVGDIVTIPVLDNDTHPDNAPIELVPELVEQPPADAGLIFTTKDTVRFKAASKPGTYTAIYQITDGQNLDAAKLTIHVTAANPEHNSPPMPQQLTARVIAGAEIRIAVPLDGIDPDGDFVYLDGQRSAPTKGSVKEFGSDYIVYQAGEGEYGSDTFDYAVRDRLGAVGTASVVIGIARPSEINHPPTPTDDIVKVRPGRTVAAAVLQNDTDPDGDLLTIDPKSVESRDGIDVAVKSNRLVFTAPESEGTYQITYRALDPHGASGAATVTVEVSKDQAAARPIARDDEVVAADVAGKESVSVPVLDNDEDPDGTVSDLTVSVGDGATVNPDGSVTVPVTSALQIIAYTITDPDKLSAEAFIIVPGANSMVPTLNPSAPALTVKSGQSLAIDLTQQITVAPGKQPSITSDKLVTARRGTVSVAGDQRVTFTSDADYYGSADVTLEVTDGTSRVDRAGNKAMVTIPITVLAPDNQPPTFSSGEMKVAAGESVSADLTKYATDPDPADAGKLSFAIASQPTGGVSASLAGSSLTVSADETAAKGTTATIGLTVTDGHSQPVPGTIVATVVGSTKPLARAVDDEVTDAKQGQPVTVNVLANDYNPFPGRALTLKTAVVETGKGQAAVQGDQVVVTPAGDFTGTLVARYRIADATGDPAREVEGRIRVSVKGKPDAPTGLAISEVGDGQVVLSWSAPAANGSPITGYTVRTSGGSTKQCPATTCTITGLSNGTAYTFTVIAHNAVGDSASSSASASATPDAVPEAPGAPSVTFGDKSLAVAWSQPTSRGTPVTAYDVRIIPAPPSGQDTKRKVSGTSLTWTGLENGVSYRLKVKAYNSLPGGSDWSVASAAETPAGKPPAPSAPSIALARNGTQTTVSWKALKNGNGDKPSSYIVYGSGAGSSVKMTATGGATSVTVNTPASTDDYRFSVSAVNKAGEGAKSAPSDPIRVIGKMSAITGIKSTVGDGSATITFNRATAPGLRSGEVSYYYILNGKRGSCGATPKCVVAGLTNGKTYTVTVGAEPTAGKSGVASEGDVSGITPFGSIKALDSSRLSWTFGRNVGLFKWPTDFSFLENGSGVSDVQVSVDGKKTANSGSATVPGDGETHTLTVKVCAGDSGCTSASINGYTFISMLLSRGPGVAGKADTYYARIDYSNLPPDTYEISCKRDDGTVGSGAALDTSQGNVATQGSWVPRGECFAQLGSGGHWLELEMTGRSTGVHLSAGRYVKWV